MYLGFCILCINPPLLISLSDNRVTWSDSTDMAHIIGAGPLALGSILIPGSNPVWVITKSRIKTVLAAKGWSFAWDP